MTAPFVNSTLSAARAVYSRLWFSGTLATVGEPNTGAVSSRLVMFRTTSRAIDQLPARSRACTL